MGSGLKKAIEEGEKIRKDFEDNSEYQDFKDLQGFLYGEEINSFLLFKINNNLKRIADSLESKK